MIFTGDYGAAGAVDLYGERYELPARHQRPQLVLVVGPGECRQRSDHHRRRPAEVVPPNDLLRSHPGGHRGNPDGVWTEERGDPIWICRGQKETWAQAWPNARHYG